MRVKCSPQFLSNANLLLKVGATLGKQLARLTDMQLR